jgi:Flp pilus assembly protein TadG
MRHLRALLARFRRDERGVFLVIFALLALVLIAASGMVVDFTRVQQARTRAQTALDSAALALQGTINNTGVTAATLKVKAQALLTERIADTSVTAVVESATPDTTAGKLTISGYISVPTYFVSLVGVQSIRSAMLSEVTRSSSDLEVSLSIDITGSMAPTYNNWGTKTSDKIGDLINASNTLIDLLVSDTQTPTYSKMAIVPWSYSVNVGSTYAANVRGTPTAGVSISNLTWYEGTSKNISSITQASEGVITISSSSTTTGIANGDWVYISGVSGMTQINGRVGQIDSLNTTAKTFKLKVGGSNLCTTSGCGYSSYSTSSSDNFRKCLVANCLEVVTTSGAHGIASGDYVYITGTSGTSSINGNTWAPTILTTTTYSLPSTSPSNGIWTSGGTSYCVAYGCRYYRFTGEDGATRVWQVNNCPTDRTTNAYTDTAPNVTPLKMNYRDSSGTDCIPNQIVPLTSNKTTLHNAIGTYTGTRTLNATGSTAGHLGLAWGWYMVSPNFAYLWPTASQPKAYNSANLIKAVVFMTDGVFNTPYCNGIVASDALSGAGGDDDHINCTSQNGSSQSQAETLCNSIKATANDTLLYVVGFDLAGNTSTLNMLQACATSADHFFQADTGADLTNAFKAIAQSLSELRISK